jgi:hypothetical protein
VVVVDEAAQALEPATLIPLQLIKPGEKHLCVTAGPVIAFFVIQLGCVLL